MRAFEKLTMAPGTRPSIPNVVLMVWYSAVGYVPVVWATPTSACSQRPGEARSMHRARLR